MTEKQHAPLNTHSLWGEQCPHCGIQIPRGGYETCSACNREFVWVRSGIDPIGETIFEGPCLPGQEQEALAYLRQKAVEEREASTNHFPENALLLRCWNCSTETLIATICSSCGSDAGWHRPKQKGGWYCYTCEWGYTAAECPACGASNAPVNIHNDRYETVENRYVAFVVVLLIVAAVLTVWAANL